ncbi:MAG: hypothetical protein AAB215_00480 [Planctomycetota bacterium]
MAHRLAGRVRAGLQAMREAHGSRYLTYRQRLVAAWRNRGLDYEILTFEEVRRRRTSETLFLIGSGPSVLRVSDEQWKYVDRHDSFGINFSFLLEHILTYHIMEDPKPRDAWLRKLLVDVLAPRRERLRDTVWFISDRQPRRGIHPRYTPELFPLRPRVLIYRFPGRLLLDCDRPFRAEDFERSVRYRGTMSVALHFAISLGYRRIVLLGVDLHTPRHFFEGMEEMQAYVRNVSPDQLDDTRPFPVMIPRVGMFRPLDEYLYALNELHFSRKGIELYVGNRDNVLCPRIPYFSDWDE